MIHRCRRRASLEKEASSKVDAMGNSSKERLTKALAWQVAAGGVRYCNTGEVVVVLNYCATFYDAHQTTSHQSQETIWCRGMVLYLYCTIQYLCAVAVILYDTVLVIMVKRFNICVGMWGMMRDLERVKEAFWNRQDKIMKESINISREICLG